LWPEREVTEAAFPEQAEAVVAVAAFPEQAEAVVAVAALPEQLVEEPAIFIVCPLSAVARAAIVVYEKEPDPLLYRYPTAFASPDSIPGASRTIQCVPSQRMSVLRFSVGEYA
jgi:hypothetical protein